MSNGDAGDGAKPAPISAVILFCIAFALALFTDWVPTLAHLSDPTWTIHQKFHAWREIFMSTAMSVTGIVMCVGPMRKGKPGTLAIVTFLGIVVVGGFWVGVPITGIGVPVAKPYANHGLQLAALCGGILVAYLPSFQRAF